MLLGQVACFSVLKAWAMSVAKRRSIRRARVALARKLSVALPRMWVDRKHFLWSDEEAAVA